MVLTIASFTIVVQQLKTIYDAFFITCCDRCRGTGIVTCSHCHGTKALRTRPGFLRTRNLRIIDNPKDHYPCYHCGPETKYDIDPFAMDDEETEEISIKIMDNMKAAVANQWPKPHEMPIYAGTVACPDCGGNPKVKRFTPDFGQALNLRGPWDLSIRRRAGQSFIGRENNPGGGLYLEYMPPGQPDVGLVTPIPPPQAQHSACLTLCLAPVPASPCSPHGGLYLEYPASAPFPVARPEMPARTIFPPQPPPPNQQTPDELENFILPYVSDDED
ncbi:hypothetical protein N2152v2_003948 [Parachlorella kessleri]